MILFEHLIVDTWTHIISIYPTNRNQFNKVLISILILGQQNKVPATHIRLTFTFLHTTTSHIDLTAKDRFHTRQTFLFATFVLLSCNVEKLFDAEHISVIGNSKARHAVFGCLIKEPANLTLAVKEGIFCMYVKMREWFHSFINIGANIRIFHEITKKNIAFFAQKIAPPLPQTLCCSKGGAIFV